MSKSVVHTESAPAPVGGAPYSQAIVAGGLVFCAGQVGIDPATGALVEGGIDQQTHRCFDNVEAVLAAAGSAPAQIVKTTVFMTDLGEFAAMNAIYAERMPAPFPARSTFEVSKLPAGARVEIEVVALAG
jgi:2-iminobutanoate/2-iminopropanoate deaminase